MPGKTLKEREQCILVVRRLVRWAVDVVTPLFIMASIPFVLLIYGAELTWSSSSYTGYREKTCREPKQGILSLYGEVWGGGVFNSSNSRYVVTLPIRAYESICASISGVCLGDGWVAERQMDAGKQKSSKALFGCLWCGVVSRLLLNVYINVWSDSFPLMSLTISWI